MLFCIGREHSIINPKWYRYFILADIAGFAVQIIGLGFSTVDIITTSTVRFQSSKGARILVVGIGIHGMALTIYLVFLITVLVLAFRAHHELGYTTFNPERGGYKGLSWRFRLFLVALLIGVVCLLTRDLYRMIDLVVGIDHGARSEAPFALLDGQMVSLSVLGLVTLHPSFVFTDYSRRKEADKLSMTTVVSYGNIARVAVI
jgi:hypothetical protein